MSITRLFIYDSVVYTHSNDVQAGKLYRYIEGGREYLVECLNLLKDGRWFRLQFQVRLPDNIQGHTFWAVIDGGRAFTPTFVLKDA
jgi:hypothetical protein